MTTSAEAALLRQEALEGRFDGPIPAHLLSSKTEREHMTDHHRSMVRYHTTRRNDFAASLAKLEAMPESDYRTQWLQHTHKCLAEHVQELDRHEAELAALMAPALQAAAE